MPQNLSQRMPEPDATSPTWAGDAPAIREGRYESLLAVANASERRAVETATRTAMALDSVASWIETAQSRFAESAQVATEAEARTSHVVTNALGHLEQKLVEIERKVETSGPASVAEALQRIESRLGAVGQTAEPAPETNIREAIRGFEGRIADLTERLAQAPRPIARRGLKPALGLEAAMAEIRQRQAQLDTLPPFAPAGPIARPQPTAPVEAAPTGLAAVALELAHAPILLSLRSDIAQLASQLDTVRGPDQAAVTHLGQELEALRSSVGSLASRDDLAQVERSILELADQVGQSRSLGEGLARINGELETLHATVQRLGETHHDGGVERTIGALSARLETLTKADPALRGAMEAQLAEIRAVVSGLASPADVSALSHTLVDLRQQVATIVDRQIDPDAFDALKTSVDDVHRVLALNASGDALAARSGVADGLRPIELLLHALVDKLDAMERQAAQRSGADPDALDALERQITDLASRLTEGAPRDPAIAHLETAMSGLMGEIATWREDAFLAAERAAQAAVTQALGDRGGWEPADARSGEGWFGEEAATKQTEEGLATVNRTLDSVAARIANLSFDNAAPPSERLSLPGDLPAAIAAPEVAPEAPSAIAEPAHFAPPELAGPLSATREPSFDNMLVEAETAIPPVADEVLLEPGSARPGNDRQATRANPAREDTARDPADTLDIKSSFIAAARRAAQAAAQEAAASRQPAAAARAGKGAGVASSPGVVGRVRALIDRHRRPVLLSAAALVLAVGTFAVFERVTPPAGPAAAEQAIAVDPVTTQSIAPKTDVATPLAPDLSIVPLAPSSATAAEPSPSSSAAARDETPSVAVTATASPEVTKASDVAKASPEAPAPALQAAPAKPIAPEASQLPAGLKQAALGGNAAAAYDYATRAAEGRGMPRDPQLAARMFEEAAKKGLVPAQYRLGNMYEKGVGVSRDLDTAKTWYKRAAEGGNARAMHNLAVLLAEGPGGKPDYDTAVAWFARAAELGVRDSQFNVAVLYARGLGTTQDLKKSYTWFAITAAAGDADSAKKRDDVAGRLSPADLATAKAAAAKWRATKPAQGANEVALPASWSDAPTTTASVKKAGREGRG